MSRTSLLQPSTLGFVAAQDMPHHLSILFRARPPLDHAQPLEKGKCKPLRGLIDGYRDFLDMFEDGEPPKKSHEVEKADVKKERIRKEKLAQHVQEQINK